MNGKPIKLLIDTAAQISVSWYKEDKNIKLRPKKYNILGLGNHQVHTHGCKNTKLKINDRKYKTEIHVVDHKNIDYDGLLGIDFLSKHNAIIDVKGREMTLYGQRVSLTSHTDVNSKYAETLHLGVINPTEQQPSCMPLILPHAVDLAPSAARILFLEVPTPAPAREDTKNEYIVEPLEYNEALDEKHIYVARSICQHIEKKPNGSTTEIAKPTKQRKSNESPKYVIPIKITNMNKQEMHLIKGTPLATLQHAGKGRIINADVLLTENATAATKDKSTCHEENRKILQEKLMHLNKEEKEKYEELILHKYKDVFEPPKIRQGTTKIEHKINTQDAAPQRRRGYKIPQYLQPHADKLIKEQLDSGTITPSFSPWSSGIVLVPKKNTDGSVKYRLTIDLRPLNSVTIPEIYPIPNMTDSINNLSDCAIYTVIDLKDGYYNIPIATEDQEKTAFSLPSGQYAGHYEYKFMTQGLRNAAATMQRFMDGILHGLQPLIVLSYIDDLLISSKSINENIQHLDEVLQRLQSANIQANLPKCQFAVSEILYVGLLISKNQIKPDPSLIAKIATFHEIEDVRDIMSYLGLSGYYRRWIKNYAEIAKPLTDLLHNHQGNIKKKVHMTEECIDAVNILKEKLTSHPILIIPDMNKDFRLTVDCSAYSCGAVLEQQGTDNKFHPCAYASRKLSPREQAFCASEREMCSLVWAVKYFRHYLLGPKTFTIVTDNAALQHVMNLKDPHSRILRWSLELSQYNYKIIHRPGTSIKHADSLSRFVNAITVFSLQDIQRHQERDKECLELSKKPNFKKENGLFWRETINGPRLVIPQSLRNAILVQEHDSILAGHSGKEATNKKVATQYWWPKRKHDIDRYIDSCDQCQKRKNHDKTKMEMMELPQSEKPFDLIGIDITQLPKSKDGFTYILTILDHFSRYLIMVPMVSQTAEEVSRAFVEYFILKFGIPHGMISDQGTQFMSDLMQNICKLLNITKLRTSSHHPEGNGRTEIVHKTIKKILSHYVNAKQDNWSQLLPYVVSCYNSSRIHSSTNKTPFSIVFGREMSSPFNIAQQTITKIQNSEVEQLADKLRHVWDEVYEANCRAFDSQKTIHDKLIKEHEFSSGDLVLLNNTTVKPGRTKKLSPNWIGPYPILKLVSRVLVQLQLEKRNIIVHKNRIKRYNARTHDTASVCSQDQELEATTITSQTPRKDQTKDPLSNSSCNDETAPQQHRPLPLRQGLRNTKARAQAGFYSNSPK